MKREYAGMSGRAARRTGPAVDLRPSIWACAFFSIGWMAGLGTAEAQLTLDGVQLLVHEDCSGCLDDPEVRFGEAAAAGDFNGDGYDDLAIGVPGWDTSFTADVGLVRVFYGSTGGLIVTSLQGLIEQGDLVAEAGDRFGASLAAGNFNGDGYDDLVVGVPGETIQGEGNAGAIVVFYGTPFGLVGGIVGPLQFSQIELAGVPEAGDQFGFSLAVGDFDGNGADDLAVGVPGEDIGGVNDAGAVNVIFGRTGFGSTGLQVFDNQILHQGQAAVFGNPGVGDRFGFALAAGDFDATGAYDDLAVGIPGETVSGAAAAGAFMIFRGQAAGTSSSLDTDNEQFWSQDVTDVSDFSQAGDEMGFALAAGDFNADGWTDLAVGVPGETTGSFQEAGLVHVFYGSQGQGLSPATDQILLEVVAPGDMGAFDRFGEALTVGDFNADRIADLAIGAPLENEGAAINAGAVSVLYGRRGLPLGYPAWQYLTQVVDSPENGDEFGFALAAGSFDGNGGDELVCTAPGETLGGVSQQGAVLVFQSVAIFTDDFESGDTLFWTSTAP